MAAEPAAAGTTVAVEAMVKRFGVVTAVDRVTFDVKAGEFVALLGPSGSGKTTILMAIAGFETPDSGTIRIGDRDVTGLPPAKRNIGMVFQRYALFPHMTVAENIAFPLKMRGISGSAAAERVQGALNMVRLDDYGNRRISQLSGGQQQRVALARALVYQPPLLLMDEPLGALDKSLREEMQLEIKRLQRKLGATVIYVTHDQGEALTMADRIAVTSAGRIQQLAPPHDVYDRPANVFVAGFIGETNFIDGELLSDGRLWRLRLDGSDISIALPGPTTAGEWKAGAKVRLAVRPEIITTCAHEEAVLDGRLEEINYGGGSVSCHVRVTEKAAIVARIPSLTARGLATGSRTGVIWPIERGQVFLA